MKRNSKIVIGVIALIIVVGLCIGRKLILWYTDNKQPNFSHETVLYVYPGMDAGQVMTMICDSAGVRRPNSLKRAFEDKKVSEYLQPGRYLFFRIPYTSRR